MTSTSVNRDIYSPLRNTEDRTFELSSSPRINVPVGKLASIITGSINSATSSGSIHGLETFNSSVLIPSDMKSPLGKDNKGFEFYDSTNTSINPILLKKLQDRQQSVLMLEITNDGEGDYKLMTLRELLLYINSIATDIDTKFNQNIKKKSMKESLSNGILGNNTLTEPIPIPRPNGEQDRTSPTPLFPQNHVFEQQLQATEDETITRETSPGYNGKDHKSTGAQYLRHRDLRRLEYHFNPLGEPTVFVRRHAVLVSLDPLRAVIMADRLLLIIPDGMDSVLELFDKALNAWSDSDNLPFEARAYEGIFSTVITIQTEEYEVFNRQVLEILLEYKHASIISIEKQEQLRLLKNKVTSMLVKISAYKRIIVELLDEDHDMALMNLSRLKKKPTLYHVPLTFEILSTHEEIEVLLESYLVDYNYLESKLEYLKSQILSAEELVLLRLDTSRNQLLIADTCIAIVACCIGFGSFIGSIFGMNLKNHHEEDPGWFHAVTTVTVVGITTLAVCVIVLLRGIGVIPHEYLTIGLFTTSPKIASQFAAQLSSGIPPAILMPQNMSPSFHSAVRNNTLPKEV